MKLALALLALAACGGRIDAETQCAPLSGLYAIHATVTSSTCPSPAVGDTSDVTQLLPGKGCIQDGCTLDCAMGDASATWLLRGDDTAEITSMQGCTVVMSATLAKE